MIPFPPPLGGKEIKGHKRGEGEGKGKGRRREGEGKEEGRREGEGKEPRKSVSCPCRLF